MEKFDKIALGIILVLIPFDVVGFVVAARYCSIINVSYDFSLDKVVSDLHSVNIHEILPALFLYGWSQMLSLFYGMFFDLFRYYYNSGYIVPFVICNFFAWLSIPIMVKYSKGMHLVKRLIYIFLIPPLIMAIAFTISFPFH